MIDNWLIMINNWEMIMIDNWELIMIDKWEIIMLRDWCEALFYSVMQSS